MPRPHQNGSPCIAMRFPRRYRCCSNISFFFILLLVLPCLILLGGGYHKYGAENHSDKSVLGQRLVRFLTKVVSSILPPKAVPLTPSKIYDLNKIDSSKYETTTPDTFEVDIPDEIQDHFVDYGLQFPNHTPATPPINPGITNKANTSDMIYSTGYSQHEKMEVLSRTRKVQDRCKTVSHYARSEKHVREIMTNREHRLAYCYIPKCGCTFWKRVIRFLNKDYKGRNVTSPFQIRRLEVHNPRYSNPDTFVPFNIFKKIGRAYNSFMFVREPYTRLWSAYVDKFYLPDFWANFEKQIKRNRHPSRSKHCVNDVTFEEFARLSLISREPHWDPMHTRCDPCTFKPSIVGRVESFSTDSEYILKQANLSWIMNGYDHDAHAQEELVTLINYNFEIIAVKPYISKCIDKMGMFRRLWKTFQINGYLPENAVTPHLDKNTKVSDFIRIVIDQYRRRPNTPDVWRKQRKQFMISAYKSVSTATLDNLMTKYARDFQLFNYDPRPAEIFNGRSL